jgi:phage shock protein A
MGLYQRIRDLVRSNVLDLLARAEDPVKLLDAAIDDMQQRLSEARSRVAVSIADERRIGKQRDGEAAQALEWERRALAAVSGGRDDLAREALSRRRAHDATAAALEEQLEAQRAAVGALRAGLAELALRLEDARRRRGLLAARAKRAEARRHLASALTAVHGAEAGDRIERLEARVEHDEAEADATWELARDPGPARDLAAAIDRLGAGELEDDLADLKARARALDGPRRAALEAPGGRSSGPAQALAPGAAAARAEGDHRPGGMSASTDP